MRTFFFVVCCFFCLNVFALEFSGEFASLENHVKPEEEPYRSALCLNGYWEFQPIEVPKDWKRNEGTPPEFPPIDSISWDETPIKVPSPWNVNTWGGGRDAGTKPHNLYWPDSVYFPSYPEKWDRIEMGRLKRTFKMPEKRIGSDRFLLRFEALAGECTVYVNGKKAGSHFDKYLPFEFDITELLVPGENELLVEVRSHTLFNKQSEKYPKMIAPYPCGSEMYKLVGITEDVFLVRVPAVRISDIFIKSLLDENRLELEITVTNSTDRKHEIELCGKIIERDSQEKPLLPEKSTKLEIGPGTAKTTLSFPVENELKTWSPDSPNLYFVLAELSKNETIFEKKLERFGWRQFRIVGDELHLNGEKIQLFGDLLHPFGPFIYSPDYVRTWYTVIKDFGGNAARPHAQIHPRHYLEIADEMGIVILDETAIFGSSIALNFEEPIAWERFEEHYDGLILRDRNHPSVLGWSFGNELFAIFHLNRINPEDTKEYYNKIVALGKRAFELDSTREWISCDGDEDLEGRIPIWSKHFGHGDSTDRLPKELDKPLMVGESGGTYYASPKQLSVFNGDRAYESYQGRNEALGIDLYDNIKNMAKPFLAFYSASETSWFGLEHLNFGYRNFRRFPEVKVDGVFFTAPFKEGKPGMQLERIPPYVTTLNPGWDKDLPAYRELAMFEAQKAAMAGKKAPAVLCNVPREYVNEPEEPDSVLSVGFIGNREGAFFKRLERIGIPFGKDEIEDGYLVFLDPDVLIDSKITETRNSVRKACEAGKTVFFMLGNADTETEKPLSEILGGKVVLTDRKATALVPCENDTHRNWTASMELSGLYFAEEGNAKYITKKGLSGPFLEKSRTVLRASNTDWSLFLSAPEHSKCAAVVLYEALEKPRGDALVCVYSGGGDIVLCTIDERNESRTAKKFWRQLFKNMGVKLNDEARGFVPAIDEDEKSLVNALFLGRLSETEAKKALESVLKEDAPAPKENETIETLPGKTWKMFKSPSKDRIVYNWIEQSGEKREFSELISFWIRSPRALDDLLSDGPDAPKFNMHFYVDGKCELYVNSKKVPLTHENEADYRRHLTYEGIPLKRGWNHMIVRTVSGELEGEQPGTIAVRISSGNREFLESLETALEPPNE